MVRFFAEATAISNFDINVCREGKNHTHRTSTQVGPTKECDFGDTPLLAPADSAHGYRINKRAVASKDSLLDSGEFAGVKLVKEIGNSASSLPMVEARRWRRDELASGVDLEAFGPICGCQNLGRNKSMKLWNRDSVVRALEQGRCRAI